MYTSFYFLSFDKKKLFLQASKPDGFLLCYNNRDLDLELAYWHFLSTDYPEYVANNHVELKEANYFDDDYKNFLMDKFENYFKGGSDDPLVYELDYKNYECTKLV